MDDARSNAAHEDLPSVLLRRDLLRTEPDPWRVQRALASGRLDKVRWGAYTASENLEGVAYECLYRFRMRAYDCATSTRHVYARQSAALLHGLSLLRVPENLCIAVLGHGGRSAQGVTSSRLTENQAARAVVIDGHHVMCLLDVLVECARFCTPPEGRVIVESALHREYGSGERSPEDPSGLYRTLRRALLSTSGRGSRRAKRIAEAMSIRSESPGETLVLDLLEEHDFETPVQQFRIGRYRVDFAWPGHRAVLELDGMIKNAGSAGGLAFQEEKARELWLQEHGWRVLRVSWDMVRNRPESVLRMLRIAGIGLRTGGNLVH